MVKISNLTVFQNLSKDLYFSKIAKIPNAQQTLNHPLTNSTKLKSIYLKITLF